MPEVLKQRTALKTEVDTILKDVTRSEMPLVFEKCLAIAQMDAEERSIYSRVGVSVETIPQGVTVTYPNTGKTSLYITEDGTSIETVTELPTVYPLEYFVSIKPQISLEDVIRKQFDAGARLTDTISKHMLYEENRVLFRLLAKAVQVTGNSISFRFLKCPLLNRIISKVSKHYYKNIFFNAKNTAIVEGHIAAKIVCTQAAYNKLLNLLSYADMTVDEFKSSYNMSDIIVVDAPANLYGIDDRIFFIPNKLTMFERVRIPWFSAFDTTKGLEYSALIAKSQSTALLDVTQVVELVLS